MTDTPPSEDDDLLAGATLAPEARQHRRSHRSHRRKGLKPLDIAGIVVAALVVIGVVIVIAKGHKSTSTATATTVTTAPVSGAGGGSTSTTAAGGLTPTTGGGNAPFWTFTTLNGKTVTVTKGTSGSTRFGVYQGNSLPLTIINVDKALANNDCAAALSVYTANKSPNSSSTANSNDRRSAYAHYTLAQATARGCAWAKALPSGG